MDPKLRLVLELGFVVVIIIVGSMGAWSYLSQHDAMTKLQATLEANAAMQKQYQQQFQDIQKQMADRDKVYQDNLNSLNLKFSRANDPQQIGALLSQIMGLKEPIQIVTPAPTPGNPNPAPIAQVPVIDAPQAKAYVQACESCKLDLSKTQADLKDRESQAKLAQQQIDSIKNERDAAIQTAKGTFWGNLKKAAKWFTIGAIVGATAAAAAHH